MTAIDDLRVARAAWSRLVEPGDRVAGAVIGALGPVDALAWLRETVADGALLPEPGGPPTLAGPTVEGLSPEAAGRLGAAVARWRARLPTLDPHRDLDVLVDLGGSLVVPEDPQWPGGLDDLGPAAPVCLWVRGSGDVGALLGRAVAVIGARASTAYGERVTAEMSAGVVGAGGAVVSGGAYGIDAVAHRAAVACDGVTVAVLAGGVDRLYPAGNARLLQAVVDSGAVVSEVPPGSVPSKSRFLQRNRLIAAAAEATVVVEAAWRSGALNTARHAAALLRPVGAVPGPVTSAASAGCHRLLREGAAVCVTDTAEVLELVGAAGEHLPPDRVVAEGIGDGLAPVVRRTWEALSTRRGATAESVARSAGLGLAEVRSSLGVLELDGLVVHAGGRWRRTR